jgi:asparagine synthase (glutamine-hydrolysing)
MAELKHKLETAVNCKLGDGLLLSGGLDSSILALFAPHVKCFTVTLESFGDDLRYAQMVARMLNLELHHKIISVEEALSIIPELIRIIASFDPALPNDLAIYFGLKLARDYGCKTVMTGDGGDELFAGYDYMFELDLADYIPKLVQNMYFSSNTISESLGLSVNQPYLEREFMKFALRLEPTLKVKMMNGKKWGKWILRKTFESSLPIEIVWRRKVPIEYGAGTTQLRGVIESKIPDDEFNARRQYYGVNFRSKEHLYYYEIYRAVVGEIPAPSRDEKVCKDCGAGVNPRSNHCKICGGFPV